ncbi:MAG TPA: hypothetical protein PLG33_01650 [Prolixibacteraceae bacterium]|jgi:hypothetical protein|nr:hypothetical protein [Prolixibacteraceae bacterium]HPR84722.1 hypothetical protein [Prolixibacteraceae bacterium]
MAYQVSIFLENKIGHLERVTAVLKDACINIRTMNLNHTANGWGILNLVVSDPIHAHTLLIEKGLSAALREILVIEIIDQPGGLDELLKEIVKAEVNFTNAYGRSGNAHQSAYFVIDTDNVTEAREKLQIAGLRIMPDEKVYGNSK